MLRGAPPPLCLCLQEANEAYRVGDSDYFKAVPPELAGSDLYESPDASALLLQSVYFSQRGKLERITIKERAEPPPPQPCTLPPPTYRGASPSRARRGERRTRTSRRGASPRWPTCCCRASAARGTPSPTSRCRSGRCTTCCRS